MAKKHVKKKAKSKVVFRHWTKEEVRILKRHYTKMGAVGLMEKLDRTDRAITIKAHTLGLLKKILRQWSEADVKRLKKYYPKMSSRKVAEKLGRTTRAIDIKASKLGLTKTKKYFREVAKRVRAAYASV